jgi:isoleucyl-tRNA synthetase
MSKSIGNVVDPQTITCGGNGTKKEQAYGIDTLRLLMFSFIKIKILFVKKNIFVILTNFFSRWWVAAHAVQHTNVPVSQAVLKNSFECTYKIRNIIRFLLGSINDLPEEISPKLCYLDQYMLNKLSQFQNEVGHVIL